MFLVGCHPMSHQRRRRAKKCHAAQLRKRITPWSTFACHRLCWGDQGRALSLCFKKLYQESNGISGLWEEGGGIASKRNGPVQTHFKVNDRKLDSNAHVTPIATRRTGNLTRASPPSSSFPLCILANWTCAGPQYASP